MSVSVARRSRLLASVARVGACVATAGLLVLAASASLQNAVADGDTRTLTFHHLHTGEDITITYKRDGRYDDDALKKLDWFMRDWRKGQSTHMDPHLFDILWEVYREIGASKPIEVVCGYRSPATNAMLRARSSGVAEFSQHTLGHAMDFYIPGASLEKLREIGMRLQAGGVGFYPSSGSPFVHMDTGSIRHWPRMTYAQLSRVFPDGKTVHVASDGRPLPHFAEALAEVERRGKAPNRIALAEARAHGAISDQQVRVAELVTQAPEKPNLLTRLFGGERSETEDVTASSSTPNPSPTQLASAEPEQPVKIGRIMPMPSARPKAANVQVAEAASPTAAGSGLMAFASTDGLGQFAKKLLPFQVASADATVTGALAYAYEPNEQLAPVRGTQWHVAAVEPVEPMERAPAAPSRSQANAAEQTTVVAKAGALDRLTSGAQRSDSLWLRAAMLTPSVRGELTATQFGASDPQILRELFYKPSEAIAIRFSEEPALDTERFAGDAIVFLAKATFVRAQTAALMLSAAR